MMTNFETWQIILGIIATFGAFFIPAFLVWYKFYLKRKRRRGSIGHYLESIGRTIEKLGVLRELLGAQRADAWIFENGSMSVAGIPRKYITLEVTTYAEGMSALEQVKFNKLDISAFIEILVPVIKKGFHIVDRNSLESMLCQNIFRETGIKESAIMLFYCNKVPSGIVTIGWMDNTTFQADYIKNTMHQPVLDIGRYLSN